MAWPGCLSGELPPKTWQARQTSPDTLAALEQLLDDHTDKEAARQLSQDGHRSGEGRPFTARIVLELRASNNLPSHADRLRAPGMLTISQIAEQLGVHPSTIKAWHLPGSCPAKPTTRTSGSTSRPPRRSPAGQMHGQPNQQRVLTQPAPGRCTVKPRP
jgi:hypothetical protein